MRTLSILRYAIWIARLAFGITLLSAVADRFGLWGPYGAPHVAWGDWAHFVHYCGVLNSYAPAALIPALAWISTIFEIAFGVAFLVGFQLEYVAYGSAILFALFAFGMTWGTGIKSPLDASVFADAAGALLFAVLLTTIRTTPEPAAAKPQL
jgi:putative oxidoreductase